mmetsp:Transcript_28549/g.68018  ORF Transcript_28549/g.68018 Transcript_28549/m.68018 type:complete len:254 (-) Transcript_28549:1261-2022(-)
MYHKLWLWALEGQADNGHLLEFGLLALVLLHHIDSADALRLKGKALCEEEEAAIGQVPKLFHSDVFIDKLPPLFDREMAVDESLRRGIERDIIAALHFLECPEEIEEAPATIDLHGVPAVVMGGQPRPWKESTMLPVPKDVICLQLACSAERHVDPGDSLGIGAIAHLWKEHVLHWTHILAKDMGADLARRVWGLYRVLQQPGPAGSSNRELTGQPLNDVVAKAVDTLGDHLRSDFLCKCIRLRECLAVILCV